MLNIPNMVMIGGNSRNSGKTSMACSLISKLSATHEVIGLKVTSIRPGEDDLHGNHNEDDSSDFTIFEEFDTGSLKDTSKMLRAGSSHVYYIRVTETFSEQAILHFLSRYINKQVIVCESRSLRGIITPGLFLMMMRLPTEGKAKDIDNYLSLADKVFYFGEDQTEKKQFAAELYFTNGEFVLIK
jgi:hypothetical protein